MELKEFFVDTGSPVTVMPPEIAIIKHWKFSQMNIYRGVNKNKVNFLGKVRVEFDSRGIRKWIFLIPKEKTSSRC